MRPATLLADPTAIRPEKIVQNGDSLVMVVTAGRARAECPRCRLACTRVHSRYVRTVAGLPWQGAAVERGLHARRFSCENILCVTGIFCERLPSVVAHYARKSVRLNAALELIGFAMGGEAGARPAREPGLIVSPDTLLRRPRQTSLEGAATSRVIGVDDFAFRRGQRRGALPVDLEKRCPIDLLPDREAGSLSAWLKAHPEVGVVSRDRSRAYAGGIAVGAPAAVQVADRWHLLKNALEQLLKRILPAKGRRTRVAARPPEKNDRTPSKYSEQSRIHLLLHLLRCGSGSNPKRVPPMHPPPPWEAAWRLLQPERLKEEGRAVIDRLCQRLCQLFPAIKEARELALEFTSMVRQRSAELLPVWLRAAAKSKLKESVGFAGGISEDYEAVRNALTYEWSNGWLEGQVSWLKLIKRMMYGRAKFDLLRARVLHST